jgi:hypothetical protein
MSGSERIEFNFSFEYDSTRNIKVNESPGALQERISASA